MASSKSQSHLRAMPQDIEAPTPHDAMPARRGAGVGDDIHLMLCRHAYILRRQAQKRFTQYWPSSVMPGVFGISGMTSTLAARVSCDEAASDATDKAGHELRLLFSPLFLSIDTQAHDSATSLQREARARVINIDYDDLYGRKKLACARFAMIFLCHADDLLHDDGMLHAEAATRRCATGQPKSILRAPARHSRNSDEGLVVSAARAGYERRVYTAPPAPRAAGFSIAARAGAMQRSASSTSGARLTFHYGAPRRYRRPNMRYDADFVFALYTPTRHARSGA